MNVYICYDKNTNVILGYIENDYSMLEDAKKVFVNFENYEVINSGIAVPQDFCNYKVVIENNEVKGYKKIEQEV